MPRNELEVLANDAEGVRQRQVRRAARRLAAAQKRALSDAARGGRIGEGIARQMAKNLDVAVEAGEIDDALGDSDEIVDSADPTTDTDD